MTLFLACCGGGDLDRRTIFVWCSLVWVCLLTFLMARWELRTTGRKRTILTTLCQRHLFFTQGIILILISANYIYCKATVVPFGGHLEHFALLLICIGSYPNSQINFHSLCTPLRLNWNDPWVLDCIWASRDPFTHCTWSQLGLHPE